MEGGRDEWMEGWRDGGGGVKHRNIPMEGKKNAAILALMAE